MTVVACPGLQLPEFFCDKAKKKSRSFKEKENILSKYSANFGRGIY
uniref:Uncharacterized protein n=1 Tax=Meloidogyne enterolobii TaxID=390850 RepID=A0A6V7XYL9_MELEN|nr:unnamed protein product [Meloidogyne enterolobii]